MKWLFLFMVSAMPVISQVDSAITIPLISVHFSGQLPFADMARRFGPDLNVGGMFMVKTKRSWVLGLETNYMFGRNVKEDVLKQLRTSESYVIDNGGYPADIRVTERGAGLHLFGGRVFHFLSQNPNSGLMLTVGIGALQHKIKLYDAQQQIAAVKGHLAYGYDHLTAGLSLSQFLGYLFISENRLLNFYFGFECYQASTKSIRKLNYDTGLPDTRKRMDILGGFRFGWILPLYSKKPSEFYYY
jgi:hypothetical protein